MRLAAGWKFRSYIDPILGKHLLPCAEYADAVVARAAELGAAEQPHRLSLLKQLLSAGLRDAKADRCVYVCGWLRCSRHLLSIKCVASSMFSA